MTNAIKALLSTAINALFGVLIAFDVVMTEAQVGAIMIFVNAVMAIIVVATANNSPTLATGANALTGSKG
jgi:uncharacterized MnhB-related membrane protein